MTNTETNEATMNTKGNKYDSSMGITDIAKALRKDIKAMVKMGLFSGLKVSVRTKRYSMGQSIDIEIKAWDGEIYNPEWVAITSGSKRGDVADTDGKYTAEASKLIDVLKALTDQWSYDNSDSMTDYYDVNYSSSVHFDHDLSEADFNSKADAAVVAKRAEEAAMENKTIRRNSKRIKILGTTAKSIRVYSLDNGFTGVDVPAERVSDVASRIAVNASSFYGNARVLKAHVHSNLWYEITDAQ